MATSRNSFQSSTTTSGLSVDRLNGFGGYSEQVKECISILKHGLGQLDLHRQPSPTQIQKQSNSSSFTEVLPVEMSSPTSSPNQNRYDTESDSINKGNSNNSTSEMPSFLRDIFRPPKGLLIHGPPGVGKSHLMRTLARAAGCPTVEITHSLLLSR
jgi:DNA replication protein DnaC